MSFKYDSVIQQYLSGTLGATISPPCALYSFVKHVDHPAVTQGVIALGETTASINSQFGFRYSAFTERYNCTSIDTAGGSSTAVFDDTVQDNIWWGSVAVLVSDTDRRIYIRTFGNSNTNATSRVTNPFAFMRVGRIMGGGNYYGAGNPNEGKIAEIGVTAGGVPSNQQITDYLNGIALDTLGFGTDLKVYVPVDTNSLVNLGSDSMGSLTANGGPVFDSDHPIITDAPGGAQVPLMGQIVM
jgi:hypothetical protein